MAGRFAAAVWLILFLASQAVTLARPLLASEAHECRCDERVCRCTHKHRQPVVPTCRFPDGTSLPTVQTCDTEEEQALTSMSYVLPPRVPLGAEPLVAVALIPLPALRLPVPFDDISPPPPRTLPA